jgi:hypothetical protein
MNVDQKKLEDWGSGIMLGMPIGLGVAALIGGGWTIGLGIVGYAALRYLSNK